MRATLRILSAGLLVAALSSAPLAAQPLPAVELEALEPAVAEQIGALEELTERRLEDLSLDDRQRAEAVGELGMLYHAYDLRSPARQCYELAAELAPEDFRWPYLLGYLDQVEGRLEEAARRYERALAILPAVRPALIRLGQVYAELGRPEAAERNLMEVARSDPSAAAARAELGELYLAQGRHAEAIQMLETALRLEPEANRLYYPLALAYRGAGEAETARQLLDKRGKVGLKPADPLIDGLPALTTGERVHLLRGRAAYAANRFREAAEEFARAVEANPESIAARVNLGSALAAQGETAAAVEQFERVAELAPANLAALYNLGSLALADGDLERATYWLREAVSYNPDDLPARLQLARALAAAGRFEAALPHYGKALKLDPASEDAWLGHASALVRLDRYADARQTLEAAHARLPASGQLAHALARLLSSCPQASLRDGARAVDLAQRVFAARPTPVHGMTLADALAETGRCEEAAALAEQVAGVLREDDSGDGLPGVERALASYRSGPPCRPPAAPPAGGE